MLRSCLLTVLISAAILFSKEDNRSAYINEEKLPIQMYDRLLNLASSALAEVSCKTSMFGTHFQISLSN